ncbi:unnamed protein product [Thelazia callipaeda]|uniref:AD domain-containing protein n=1 Tax=Thelazia callipaeda TaxID=103827 RepID=A0A0N5CXX5_THECL|nr:unnamed protein product [Thelazia callipaeda]
MTVFNGRTPTTTATVTPSVTTSSAVSATSVSAEERAPNNCKYSSRETSDAAEATPVNILDSNVVFPVGSVLECRSVMNSTTVGQVICSDHSARLLALKDTSVADEPSIRIINLGLVSQVTSLQESDGKQVSPPWSSVPVSVKQVQERLERAIIRKKASVMQTNVPIEAQKIFIHLRKTLERKVEWSGSSIKILDRVIVRPPYTADSVEQIGDISNVPVNATKDHVRKIVRSLRKL